MRVTFLSGTSRISSNAAQFNSSFLFSFSKRQRYIASPCNLKGEKDYTSNKDKNMLRSKKKKKKAIEQSAAAAAVAAVNTKALREEKLHERIKKRAAFARRSTSLVEEFMLEVTATKTVVIILFLFLVGASMMATYLISKHPDCFGQVSRTSLRNQKQPGEIPSLRNGSVVGSIESAKKKEEEMKVKSTTDTSSSSNNNNGKCTLDQMSILARQLPGDNCHGRNAWSQSCSFTKATTRGCYDPIWAREFFAQTDLTTPFKSLFINLHPGVVGESEFPIDSLHVGSHKKANGKYNVADWIKVAKVQPSCLKDVEVKGKTEQEAQSYIVSSDMDNMKQVQSMKNELGLSDEEMSTAYFNTESNTLIREFIMKKTPNKEPIHWFWGRRGYGFLVSYFSTKTLSRVWYLEFQTGWKGEWATGDPALVLKDILPKNGFVCYYAGSDNNLWRITDCWQTHYSFKTWANIACVNVDVEETKPLYDRMEEIFHETLKKDISF